MTEFLELKVADCKHCYKCIRNCPVKAIQFSNNQATIIQEECILCGRCFVSCPQKAKRVHSDLEKTQKLIDSNLPVFVTLAPSFIANYQGATIEQMEKSLKALGFVGVSETAKGATLVKQQYDLLAEKGEKDVMISTCCHTVNMLVEKYFPKVLPYMTQVITPMQADGMSLRKRYPDCRVVFIGPCVSKKAEVAQYPKYISSVLTFEELNKWFIEKGIEIPSGEGVKKESTEGKARLFPIPGGILRSMEKRNKEYHYIAVDGMDHCIEALKDIEAGKISKCFIEMSACAGSCVGGPGMGKVNSVLQGTCYVNSHAAEKDFTILSIEKKKMKRELFFEPLRHPRFGEKAIATVLSKMGKTKLEDELNCGSCGYDTCRDKAEAVLAGKANLEMCLPYLMNKAQSFSETIINNTPNGVVVLNADFKIQQLNQAACNILNVKKAEDVVGENIVCLMDPSLFFEVLDEGKAVYDSRQYLTEYGKYIELTVVCDNTYGVVIGIMRDTTQSETARASKQKIAESTVDVTNRVIEKQMRTAQEIASLLGETVAETKIALTKLKETLHND